MRIGKVIKVKSEIDLSSSIRLPWSVVLQGPGTAAFTNTGYEISFPKQRKETKNTHPRTCTVEPGLRSFPLLESRDVAQHNRSASIAVDSSSVDPFPGRSGWAFLASSQFLEFGWWFCSRSSFTLTRNTGMRISSFQKLG